MRGLKPGESRKLVLAVLGDGKPRSSREVQIATGLSASAVNNALILCWKRGWFCAPENRFFAVRGFLGEKVA